VDTTLHDPLIGRELDGRYRVESRIAVGGMATVYRGVDTRLDRAVALKVMHPALAADPDFTARFIREAKAAARLSHPNVVNVFDQGQDGGVAFLAMEYVPGWTVRDLLRDRGALTVRTALDVLEPVLAALGAAHRAGLVHRDVKPENVLLTDGGLVKVADFGLVRAVSAESSGTTTGQVLGTVSYLAPEQIERGDADPRSDVYAAGVLLYEMLTGAKPHTGGTPVQVIYRHLNEDVPAPSASRRGLPRALDALTAAATARDAARRPPDAVALLAMVQRCRAQLTPAQLDAEPPRVLPGPGKGVSAGASGAEPTTVLPAGAPANGVERTSVLDLPPELVMPRHGGFDGEPPAAEPRRGFAAAGPGLPGASARRRSAWRPWVFGVTLAAIVVAGLTWGLSSALYTTVPAVLRLPEASAERQLRSDGLAASVQSQFSETVPRGDVVSSSPGPGARVRKDGTVALVVSAGPERHAVPDVAGTSLAEAKRAITAARLAVGTVRYAYSSDVRAGRVVGSSPGAGRSLAPNTPVTLTVSRGPAPVALPSVVGLPVDQAQQQLTDAGFTVQVAPSPVYSDTVAAGDVARQSPGGATAPTGATVTLTLSQGPQLFPVPDVTGETADQATGTLEAAGFKVHVITVNPLADNPTVHEQSPGGGSDQPKGTKISLLAY